MKVGILSFPHSPSIGAMLQMGALYQTIEDLGYNVEIINYVSDKVNHQQKKDITLKSVVVNILSKILLKSAKPSYVDFEKKLKMFPDTPTCTEEGLLSIASHFDRIIVGSDQVWNPDVTGHDLNFYLKFCDCSNKKISYAASFGFQHLDPQDTEEIKHLLNDFSYISVREKDGQNIVESLTGRKATLVLDPTLLIHPQYYMNSIRANKLKRKYVLFYCIKPSSNLYYIAKEYAKENGFELVTVGGRIKDRFNPTKHPQYGVGPTEFISLVNSAECVFTNSFHGVAISIALHTDFYVELSSETNSRLINITQMFQLQDRIIEKNVPNKHKVDYIKVDRLLAIQRERSMNYLIEALN